MHFDLQTNQDLSENEPLISVNSVISFQFSFANRWTAKATMFFNAEANCYVTEQK